MFLPYLVSLLITLHCNDQNAHNQNLSNSDGHANVTIFIVGILLYLEQISSIAIHRNGEVHLQS